MRPTADADRHSPETSPPSEAELERAKRDVVALKLSATGSGWSPLLRQRFGYFTPDEWYEATLSCLVGPETTWLDVGCGRSILPANPPLSARLAARARLVVGLDPSDNIDSNTEVHERAKCLLEDYHTDRRFDLLTMRMVAEHITDPEAAVAALARLAKPGGRVVVYTVSRWSPASILAAATPMAVHHWLKRVLWRASPQNTFPTAYRMNTRATLARQFAAGGFAEEQFHYLDDCRSLARWRLTATLELALWRALRGLGLRYPELCLLAIYRRLPDDVGAGAGPGGAA
jgi:2-polyprenyl-3-methyl-5-hydroxy-6-metoxy-1,4-benzoquinol methylase